MIMKSLAEQLGDLLPNLPVSDTESAADSPHSTADGADAVWSAVYGALSEETGLAPDEISAESVLDDQLNLRGLSLWSVVAQIEYELKLQFEDAQVLSWNTASDVLEAAYKAKDR